MDRAYSHTAVGRHVRQPSSSSPLPRFDCQNGTHDPPTISALIAENLFAQAARCASLARVIHLAEFSQCRTGLHLPLQRSNPLGTQAASGEILNILWHRPGSCRCCLGPLMRVATFLDVPRTHMCRQS